MRIIENNKSVFENKKSLRKLIDSHLEPLLTERRKNQQKILEICHVGKFLMFFENDFEISKVTEKPDFILTNGTELVGLEHQILVDNKSKEREGFFKNIFDLAELELKKDNSLPNFLANCYLLPYVNFKLSEKEELIATVVRVVKKYVLTDILEENPLIERIWKMPHSGINISESLGAWWQKDLTNEILIKAVSKKEKLISKYKENSTEKQWLLIVIGSNGDSSYLIDRNIKYSVKSEFDKVFVLEDFNNNLYEIK
ncbi:hypothetical protein DZC72_03970 [Maribacter algicola]|uniref:Uncharacterized protein n=1 Tax=Maribacter algicola TaxID=2498892 RepID=A0A3R8Q0I4_9FLAO|nr:hypothetical protein [Maribacter algicola]RRQ49756.1 hypothetical protein DZC72_03970 [Maribacter algicola]